MTGSDKQAAIVMSSFILMAFSQFSGIPFIDLGIKWTFNGDVILIRRVGDSGSQRVDQINSFSYSQEGSSTEISLVLQERGQIDFRFECQTLYTGK